MKITLITHEEWRDILRAAQQQYRNERLRDRLASRREQLKKGSM